MFKRFLYLSYINGKENELNDICLFYDLNDKEVIN